ARIFFPVDEVSRGSHRGAPEVLFGARLGTAVVVSVIAAFVLDDLVQGNEVLVIVSRTGSQHGFVPDVRPNLQIARRRQPHAEVVAFIKKVPDSILEPGGWRSIGALSYRLAPLAPDIQLAHRGPIQPVPRHEQMGAVVAPLGK